MSHSVIEVLSICRCDQPAERRQPEPRHHRRADDAAVAGDDHRLARVIRRPRRSAPGRPAAGTRPGSRRPATAACTGWAAMSGSPYTCSNSSQVIPSHSPGCSSHNPQSCATASADHPSAGAISSAVSIARGRMLVSERIDVAQLAGGGQPVGQGPDLATPSSDSPRQPWWPPTTWSTAARTPRGGSGPAGCASRQPRNSAELLHELLELLEVAALVDAVAVQRRTG